MREDLYGRQGITGYEEGRVAPADEPVGGRAWLRSDSLADQHRHPGRAGHHGVVIAGRLANDVHPLLPILVLHQHAPDLTPASRQTLFVRPSALAQFLKRSGGFAAGKVPRPAACPSRASPEPILCWTPQGSNS